MIESEILKLETKELRHLIYQELDNYIFNGSFRSTVKHNVDRMLIDEIENRIIKIIETKQDSIRNIIDNQIKLFLDGRLEKHKVEQMIKNRIHKKISYMINQKLREKIIKEISNDDLMMMLKELD